MDLSTGSMLLRMRNFKSYTDVLLALVDYNSVAWLSSKLRNLANSGADLTGSVVVGDEPPFSSPDGVVVTFRRSEDGFNSGLTEVTPNSFNWSTNSIKIQKMADLLDGITDAVAFHGVSGISKGLDQVRVHQYLMPENSPPAPPIIISLNEYDFARLREKRGQ